VPRTISPKNGESAPCRSRRDLAPAGTFLTLLWFDPPIVMEGSMTVRLMAAALALMLATGCTEQDRSEAEKDASDVAADLESAGEEAIEETEQAADEAGQAIEGAVDEAGQEIEEAGRELDRKTDGE
jgi:hypothetical protein